MLRSGFRGRSSFQTSQSSFWRITYFIWAFSRQWLKWCFAGPSTTLLKQVGAPHLFAKPVARDHLVIFLQLPVRSWSQTTVLVMFLITSLSASQETLQACYLIAHSLRLPNLIGKSLQIRKRKLTPYWVFWREWWFGSPTVASLRSHWYPSLFNYRILSLPSGGVLVGFGLDAVGCLSLCLVR